LVLLPDDAEASDAARRASIKVVQKASLQGLLAPDVLTDGFDDWRALWFTRERGPDPFIGAVLVNVAEDNIAPNDPGYNSDDYQRLDSFSNRLGSRPWSAASGLGREECFHTFCIPFDAAPCAAADWLMNSLCGAWWEGKAVEQLAEEIVLLPVDVDQLIKGSPKRAALQERLAYAVNKTYPRAHVSGDALAVALRRSDAPKLILVAYDLPSVELVNVDESGWKSRKELWQELRALGTCGIGGWFRQVVVAICSDAHHERMWRGPEGLAAAN
jgi:hypothetical protein